MHPSSIENMKYFIKKYVHRETSVLDVGSQEVPGQENSSYRKLFPESVCYTGCDMVSGKT